MPRKRDVSKQILQYVAGMGTELLYTVFLIAVAFIISALVLRWF